MSRFACAWRKPLSLLVAAALVTAGDSARALEPLPTPNIDVALKPAAPDTQNHVGSVDVVLKVTFFDPKAGAPLLRMALVSSNVQTAADALQGLEARDDSGPLALTAKDETGRPDTRHRVWTADRDIQGELTVRYRVPITNALNPRGAAPPFELRTEDGAFSGAGSAFLPLPEIDRPVSAQIRWDLSAMPPGAIGLSSFGPAGYGCGPVSRLDNAFYMGGLAHAYPVPSPDHGFFSAWQGKPPFDGGELMAWTRDLYDRYLGFFHADPKQPYGVFLRPNPVNAGGGVELDGSFVGTFGPQTQPAALRFTLAHEMLHTFVRGLDGSDGLSGSWFSEGIAVYYQRTLPLRFGKVGPDGFLKDLNTTAGRYYTDLLNDTPNKDIPARFWADTRVRVLPYDRGALYFAAVDGEVRRASGGKRNLDDLILAMLDLRRQGQPMDEAAWRRTLRAELGPAGEAGLDAMLSGALVLPRSDDFGPCFRRTTAKLRRYELGFAPQVLTEPTRTIRGLVHGSAAEAAGLRDGDQIVEPVPQDQIQADQGAHLTLQVRRDGKVFPVRYLPRGETVDAYQWERIPGVPDSACAR
jgi:hypothetical protein